MYGPQKPAHILSFIAISIAIIAVILTLISLGISDEPLVREKKGWDRGERILHISSTKHIPPSRIYHILYGDAEGGGHKYGTNKPCKSEFPASWDDAKIISTIEKIAANDNNKWIKQKNGYYVHEENEGKIRIRVVMSRNKKYVVTAYPVNVPRNPCPAANDNQRQYGSGYRQHH